MPGDMTIAATNPGTGQDATLGYVPGSRVVNSANSTVWECVSNATGAAIWQQLTPAAGRDPFFMPTGALAESVPRWLPATVATAMTSGTLRLQAIAIAKGVSITNISFMSGTTALAGGSNQWFALFDNTRTKLGVTSDDTSTAWAASTVKTLAITGGPFVATYTGLYFLGIVVVATTMPTLFTYTGNLAGIGLTPVLAGTSSTGLTNPASCPAGPLSAPSAGNVMAYAYIS